MGSQLIPASGLFWSFYDTPFTFWARHREVLILRGGSSSILGSSIEIGITLTIDHLIIDQSSHSLAKACRLAIETSPLLISIDGQIDR